ncbi:uncharacterized protein DUF4339 [Dokdonia sp. Hel_I_63]|uniref:DUF4339 domain-containing protein n=1 Tax=Dokdonia sp. Hel_I_63 TaxID=1249996 RepID=UPI00119C4198|nr:DUF4339 domain-containing protein [Dokdonia sp. Hel_I_63]TVZ23766.1 uncharacterized protein DUF4339 [Dokdonia sp. Hel_I_63]
MTKYFYLNGDKKLGPFIKEELIEQNLNRDSKIWYYGLEDWKKLSDIVELVEILNSLPPDLNTRNHQQKKEVFVTQKTQNVISAIKVSEKKNNKNLKWIIIGLVTLIIVPYIYQLFTNQTESDLYESISTSSYESDVDFQMYVDKFYRDIRFYGVYPKKPKTTIIRFSKLDQLNNTTHIHGLSYGSNDDDRIEIYINPSSWTSFNKPMRYFLMYHELAHDILNVDDLEEKTIYKGKLMYPAISDYEKKNMDDFIESSHELFEEIAEKQN